MAKNLKERTYTVSRKGMLEFERIISKAEGKNEENGEYVDIVGVIKGQTEPRKVRYYKKHNTSYIALPFKGEVQGSSTSTGALEYAFVPDSSTSFARENETYDNVPTMMQQLNWLASDLNWARKQREKPQSFTGKWEFLSNMYLCTVIIGDMVFPSAENAFQAMKCKTRKEMQEFQYITPYEAKKRGEQVDLRSNWDEIRLKVMKEVLKAKFQDQELAVELLKTEDMFLCEKNYWGDTFWGKAPVQITHYFIGGNEVSAKEFRKAQFDDKQHETLSQYTEKKIIGENNLGKLLCEVREEIRQMGTYEMYFGNYQEQVNVDMDWLVSKTA